eukprot:1239309-Amphidinium_carterae.1
MSFRLARLPSPTLQSPPCEEQTAKPKQHGKCSQLGVSRDLCGKRERSISVSQSARHDQWP